MSYRTQRRFPYNVGIALFPAEKNRAVDGVGAGAVVQLRRGSGVASLARLSLARGRDVTRWERRAKIFSEKRAGLPQGSALLGIHRFGGAGGADLTEKKVAAFLAVAACLGADAAVIVHLAVAFAFVGAGLAGDDAGVELRVHEFVGRFRLPREDAERRVADVGAIEIRAKAAAQVLEVLGFAEAGVGAGGAGVGAREECAERLGVDFHALWIRTRVAAKHQFDRFHKFREGPGQLRLAWTCCEP